MSFKIKKFLVNFVKNILALGQLQNKTPGKPIKWTICLSPVLSKVFLDKRAHPLKKLCYLLNNEIQKLISV